MNRRGMTLIEMLVAMTATLILMGAIARVFSVFGTAITNSRAVLATDAQLRTAAWRLRSDLSGITCRTLPPRGPDAGEGYFELIEGPAKDADASDATTIGPADHDDVLLFTTRSADTPFVGRAPSLSGTTAGGQNDLFESNVAEVAWFARPTLPATNPPTFTLYRKQLLVMGYVGTDPFYSSSPGSNNSLSMPLSIAPGSTYPNGVNIQNWNNYYNLPCDVSVRWERGTTLYPNTLADLTRRENRFMHNVIGTSAAFPFPFVAHQFGSNSTSYEDLAGTNVNGLIFDNNSARKGEDVVLTNVLSFDVRVFDPAAPVAISASGNTALVPGDPLYPPAIVNGGPVASGAYVDLGVGIFSNSLLSGSQIYPRFAGYGLPQSQLVGSAGTRRTYDTWSTHYEANGRDEDSSGTADEGTDGIDNNSDGQIDEVPVDTNGDGVPDIAGELETSPPYPFPLRGVEVRLRCYEPSSGQVRQMTVRHSFVPH